MAMLNNQRVSIHMCSHLFPHIANDRTQKDDPSQWLPWRSLIPVMKSWNSEGFNPIKIPHPPKPLRMVLKLRTCWPWFLQPIVQGLSRAHRYILSGFSPRVSAKIGWLPSVSTEKRVEVEAVCCCHSDKEYTYYTYYTYCTYYTSYTYYTYDLYNIFPYSIYGRSLQVVQVARTLFAMQCRATSPRLLMSHRQMKAA